MITEYTFMSILRKIFKTRGKKNENNINFLDAFVDSDSDGLSDWEEIKVYKTDPYNPDTDGDGVSDGDEVKMGRNPLGPGRLKNAFLANSDNNYHPHIFHIKKMLFLSFSAFFVKSLAIFLIMIIPVGAWMSPSIYSSESDKIIDLTNKLRRDLSIPSLVSNEKLKQASLNKANDIFVNQYFAHVSDSGKDLAYWIDDVDYNYSIAGENIIMGYKGAESIFNSWKRSEHHYDNLVNPSFRHVGVAMLDGVFDDRNTIVSVQIFGSNQEVKEKVFDKDKVSNIRYGDFSGNESDELTAPFFTIPYESNLINSNEIALDIIAPNAESVSVYVDNELFKKEDLGIFKNFQTILNLKDGEHIIQVKSLKQGKELSSIRRTVHIDTLSPSKVNNDAILAVNKLSEGEYVIKAVAVLESDVASSRVSFSDYNIKLTKRGENKWSGQIIISDYEDVFETLVQGDLIIIDYAGNIAKNSIGWEGITPIKTPFLEKYSFLKNSNYSNVNYVFNIVNFYLLFLITIFSFIMLINMFLGIKKQKKYIIFFVFLFIAFLSGIMVI